MEVIIRDTSDSASAVAAGSIAKPLRDKPDAILGLATGSTPLLLDRAAASKFKPADYDRWVYESKPEWQRI